MADIQNNHINGDLPDSERCFTCCECKQEMSDVYLSWKYEGTCLDCEQRLNHENAIDNYLREE